ERGELFLEVQQRGAGFPAALRESVLDQGFRPRVQRSECQRADRDDRELDRRAGHAGVIRNELLGEPFGDGEQRDDRGQRQSERRSPQPPRATDVSRRGLHRVRHVSVAVMLKLRRLGRCVAMLPVSPARRALYRFTPASCSSPAAQGVDARPTCVVSLPYRATLPSGSGEWLRRRAEADCRYSARKHPTVPRSESDTSMPYASTSDKVAARVIATLDAIERFPARGIETAFDGHGRPAV